MNKDGKLIIPYKVKDENPNPILDLDSKEGYVKMVWNTYDYVDEDGDILMPGCAAKSISERGPGATTAAIKHALFHNIERIPGKVTHLQEEEFEHNGKKYQGIVAISKLELSTDDGRDTFLKYDSGIYDNHSIGFRYLNMSFVEPGSEEWKRVEELITNPEKLQDMLGRFGGVWRVKEIKLYEGSTVAFGSNDMTPVLGIKGALDQATKDEMLNIQFKRQNLLIKALKSGRFTDETMIDFEIQYQQSQQIIYELSKNEPLKSTHQSREEHSDKSGGFDLKQINQKLNF